MSDSKDKRLGWVLKVFFLGLMGLTLVTIALPVAAKWERSRAETYIRHVLERKGEALGIMVPSGAQWELRRTEFDLKRLYQMFWDLKQQGATVGRLSLSVKCAKGLLGMCLFNQEGDFQIQAVQMAE